MRILVTGSREWTDTLTIARTIQRYMSATLPMLKDEEGRDLWRDVSGVTIVHGGARGVDQLTERWAVGCQPPIKTEVHALTREHWQENPRTAGYIRNGEMVRLGADVCIAFLLSCRKVDCDRIEPHATHGGSHCADLAESQGIMTIRVGP